MTTKKQCIANECVRDACSRSMCLMHYKRWQKYGNPNARTHAPRGCLMDQRIRFHGWVVAKNGCWEWSGRRDRASYGRISIGPGDFAVSRVVYEAWVGPIPDGYIIRHRCDNPPCMNPDHLETGTHADNSRDRDTRGRSAGAYLSDAEVAEIRTRLPEYHRRQILLAKEYGVTNSYISAIKSGKTR